MFSLEVKKLFKRKIFLMIVIFAAIISYYNIYTVSSDLYAGGYSEVEENPFFYYYFMLRDKIQELELDGHVEKAKLLEEKYERLKDLAEDRRVARLEAKSNGDDLNLVKEASLKAYDLLLYFDYVVDEFDIELTQSQIDGLEWYLKKFAYYIETDSYQLNVNEQKNLGRFFRFGAENLLGILAIAFLAFLSLDSFPREYESGTIVTLYTQPYKKRTVIFSKYLSFILMSITYVLSTIFFTIIFCVLKGYSLKGLNSISRVIADEMVYIKTWEYFILCIGSFLILNLLIYSFVLFVGSITKSSSKTMIIVMAVIIFGYIITSSGYFDTLANPLYLLNYSDIILGKFEMPFTSINETIYKKNNSVGYIPYLYMLLPAVVFFIFSIVFQNSTTVKKKKEKKSENYRRLKNLYEFELKKIKSYNSALLIFLISILTISIIFSIMIVDDITMINKKKGEEGDVALREKEVEIEKDRLDYIKGILNNEELLEDKGYKGYEEQLLKDYENNLLKAEYYYLIYKNIYEYYDENNSEGFYSELLKTIPRRFLKHVDYVYPTYKGETGRASEFAVVTSIERVNELKERNIKPILQTERQDTAYDQYIDPYEERIQSKYNKPLTHSGLYSIFRMNKDYYLSYILLFFITLFFCGGYTYDKETGNQMVLLYTEPINRRKYHYTKILSSILISAVFLSLIYLAIILFGWITEDLGHWNYPILHYDAIAENVYKQGEKFEGTYSFINLSTYILRVFIMSLFSISFIASLTTLLSLKLKGKNYVVFATVIIIVLGTILGRTINIKIIQMLLPFVYLDVANLADGAIKVLYNNEMLTLFMGMCVLSFWTLVLTSLGLEFTEKSEVK